MLRLAEVFAQPDVAYLAPQAPGGSWSPYRSLHRSIRTSRSCRARSCRKACRGTRRTRVRRGAAGLARLLARRLSRPGVRGPQRAGYGAVIGLSAGLIGPEDTPRAYAGSLAGTHVFLGCSDIDANIPLKRMQDSARVLRRLEDDVVERIYPGMGHTINDDEIGHVRAALVGILYPLLTIIRAEIRRNRVHTNPAENSVSHQDRN
jgi:phospholipase/carboxylesterase